MPVTLLPVHAISSTEKKVSITRFLCEFCEIFQFFSDILWSIYGWLPLSKALNYSIAKCFCFSQNKRFAIRLALSHFYLFRINIPIYPDVLQYSAIFATVESIGILIFFLGAIYQIQTKYGYLLCKFQYSIQMGIIQARKNCEFKNLPAGICILKVNNTNIRASCKNCSKLTIKSPELVTSFWWLYC